mgnify:CR=1 FL=1
MLDLFRKKKKGLKWTLWVVIFALSGGMILLFVDVPTGGELQLGSQDVAVVAGNRISAKEFRRSYQQAFEFFRENYGGEQNPEVFKKMGLHIQVLNQLIGEHAVFYEAKRLGIHITPQEIAQRIADTPTFQENNSFIGPERYKEILALNNVSSSEYESRVQLQLGTEKLSRIITDNISSTSEEVMQKFLEKNQEIKLRYVQIKPLKLAPKKVKEKELQNYYDQNRQDYQVPEQRKVKYIQTPIKLQEILLTEEQIQERIPSIPEKQAVRASHILVATIDSPGAEATAQKKAKDLLRKLRKGANFGEVAKKYSDDKATGSNKGDLGFFSRGATLPEFEKIAFSLDPGQISELVRTPFGFHIIKVTDVRTGNRRNLAESQLREEEGKHHALNQAAKILYQAKNGAGLDLLAEQHQLKAGETSFFGLSDAISTVSVRSDFNQQIFTLNRGQVIESPYDTGEGFLVAQLTDITSPKTAEYESVKERVLKDFKSSRGEELAREKAFALAKAAREGLSLSRAARKARLKVFTTGFFKQHSTINEDLGAAREIHEQAFRGDKGTIISPVLISDNYIVAEVAAKTKLDEEEFQQHEEETREQLIFQKRSAFFAAWIKNVVESLYEKNQIEVNMELIEAIIS